MFAHSAEFDHCNQDWNLVGGSDNRRAPEVILTQDIESTITGGQDLIGDVNHLNSIPQVVKLAVIPMLSRSGSHPIETLLETSLSPEFAIPPL